MNRELGTATLADPDAAAVVAPAFVETACAFAFLAHEFNAVLYARRTTAVFILG